MLYPLSYEGAYGPYPTDQRKQTSARACRVVPAPDGPAPSQVEHLFGGLRATRPPVQSFLARLACPNGCDHCATYRATWTHSDAADTS